MRKRGAMMNGIHPVAARRFLALKRYCTTG
jgi:hypothetical protein